MLGGVFHLHEQEAREVMTPIPAVVTVNADETVEEALRSCVSSGHTRLVVIEDDNPDRVRGHRPQQQPRPPLHERRPRRLDRARDPRRADLPRDEAARRPARRAPAPAQLDRGRLRRVRADGRDRHRRGHPRGGRRRDRGRDRPARRPRCAGSPTATGTSAATSRSATSRTPGSSCRSTPTPSTRSAATSSPSSAGCPKRGDTIRANGYEIRVESVRENRIVAVRIHAVTAEHRAIPGGPRSRAARGR